MKVHTKRFTFDMEADVGFEDITSVVEGAVLGSGLSNGTVTVFAVGSTAAVTTLEYEPGLQKDLPRALEVIAPSGIPYAHHMTWHDGNGKSHVRSAVIGPSLVVPFTDRKLVLGTWQQIVLMNLDTSRRQREIVLQIMGE
jgi:secondary thiamine-phosphate synthase enzyme